MTELKCLIESLLENLNDKLTANLHQRKVNKMLANRIQDLEKQISVYLKPKLSKQDVMSSFDDNETSSDGMERPIVPEKVKNNGQQQQSNQVNFLDTNFVSSSSTMYPTAAVATANAALDVNLNESISLIRFEDDYISKNNK